MLSSLASIGSTISVWGWLAVMICALVFEAVIPGLISIWFAFGAVAALVAAALGASFNVQIGLFLTVSALSLVLTRPLAMKYVNKKVQPTNADRVIGKEAIVTEEINTIEGTGRVKAFGQDWAACPEPLTDTFVEGELVRILRIDGVKLVVSKLEDKIEY